MTCRYCEQQTQDVRLCTCVEVCTFKWCGRVRLRPGDTLPHDQSLGKPVIDIATVNAILLMLGQETLKYPPESKESIALMKFMQRLSE